MLVVCNVLYDQTKLVLQPVVLMQSDNYAGRGLLDVDVGKYFLRDEYLSALKGLF